MFVPYLLIILAAAAGVILASYIRYKKTSHQVLVCPLHANCEAVTHSKFSRFLGIPVEIIGIFYYFVIAAIYTTFLLAPATASAPAVFAAGILTTIAFLFSLYLTFIQAFTLRQWCTWCLLSAALCTLIFGIAITSINEDVTLLLANSYRLILALHLLGIAFGLAGASITDILFFKFLKDLRISKEESNVMDTLSQVIWLGIAILVVSGIGLYLPQAEALNYSSKFLLKMVVVSVIIVNGACLNLIISPRLVDISFAGPTPTTTPTLRRLRPIAFAFGAISATSWYTAFFLGILRSLPATFPQLLLFYIALLAGAVATSQVIGFLLTRRQLPLSRRGTTVPTQSRPPSYIGHYWK